LAKRVEQFFLQGLTPEFVRTVEIRSDSGLFLKRFHLKFDDDYGKMEQK
jgi:hypothetical protein